MSPDRQFYDRRDAGTLVAEAFRDRLNPDALVLGLPRGGVVVASALAETLDLTLDVDVVRKLRAQSHPEFAIGAIAEDGQPYVDVTAVRKLSIGGVYLQDEEARQRSEIRRQVELYRQGRPVTSPTGRHVVVVDDGIATGATVHAAVLGLRHHEPASVVVAVPVASIAAVRLLSADTDQILALSTPGDFWAVGQYYQNFEQVADEEVAAAVSMSRRAPPNQTATPDAPRSVPGRE